MKFDPLLYLMQHLGICANEVYLDNSTATASDSPALSYTNSANTVNIANTTNADKTASTAKATHTGNTTNTTNIAAQNASGANSTTVKFGESFLPISFPRLAYWSSSLFLNGPMLMDLKFDFADS